MEIQVMVGHKKHKELQDKVELAMLEEYRWPSTWKLE